MDNLSSPTLAVTGAICYNAPHMQFLKPVIFTFILALSLSVVTSAFAEAKASQAGILIIKKIIGKYNQAEAVEMKIIKRVKLALLDEERESAGQILFSKGKMRIEIDKPEASLIVVSANVIWVVSPTPKELGGRDQITKISSKELSKQAKAPLAMLLARPAAWDHFKIQKQTTAGEILTLKLAPINKADSADISSLILEINLKENSLKSMSYTDEIENETKYIFKNINFSAKLDSNSFIYTPPKGAEISTY